MNTVRIGIVVCSLAALTACFDKVADDSGGSTDDSSASADVVRAGTWNLTVEQSLSNSCVYSDADLGVGNQVRINVATSGDDIVITNAAGDDLVFVKSGSNYVYEYTQLYEVQDPCYIRGSVEETLSVVGNEFVEIRTDAAEAIEGDCSAWDTTGWPCSYALSSSAEWVGE
ncbi:MAG: hypothetical protein H6739_16810 [Alphaproteobacteria bacterium]|nr:hypothetical protein [Alphaproteobacteria bacterium]